MIQFIHWFVSLIDKMCNETDMPPSRKLMTVMKLDMTDGDGNDEKEKIKKSVLKAAWRAVLTLVLMNENSAKTTIYCDNYSSCSS